MFTERKGLSPFMVTAGVETDLVEVLRPAFKPFQLHPEYSIRHAKRKTMIRKPVILDVLK